MKVVIIGLGGIGSDLCENLSRFLNFHQDSHGSEILLADGDSYEFKNMERQSFLLTDNKAKVKKLELEQRFRNLNFDSFEDFVTSNNVHEVVQNECVVFLCVDNHKTRKLISDHCEKLQNVIVISGGNEWTDGNVQIFEMCEGRKKTPSLTDYHPEIQNPTDKSPHEMSCEELSMVEPQLLFSNLSASLLMCWAFYNILTRQEMNQSEIYFDINALRIDSKVRTVPQAN